MKKWPKLILALDIPHTEMDPILDEVSPGVSCFKVGLKTIVSPYLMEVVGKVKKRGGMLFLDGKLHDIPNTVANAARSLVKLGADGFTVHASGGKAMMQAAREAAAEEADRLGLNETPAPVAVTVLTSMDGETWQHLYRTSVEVKDQVLHFVEEALAAGLDAVVASPLEVEAIRARFGKELSIITPGVRPNWAAAGDQKRIAKPGETLARGATALVIGRPILYPPEEVGGRVRAVELVMEEIK